MDQMPRAIEREAILRERAAEAPKRRLSFEDNRVMIQQMISGTDSCQASANDNNFFHECISTFRSRYAERQATDIVPTTAATAQPS